MGGPIRGLAAVGLVAFAVLVIGFGVVGGWPRSGAVPPIASGSSGPSATPTARPVPTATPTTSPSPTPEPSPYGKLAAGTYTTRVFPRPLTYSVPKGWWNDADDRTAFVLSRGSPQGPDNIEVLYDVYPPVLDEQGCQDRPDWDKPHRTADLIDYWSTHPGLSITARTPITLGQLHGWRVVLSFAKSWRNPCGANGESDAPAYVVQWYDGVPVTHGIGPGTTSFLILDDPDGRTLLIGLNGDSAGFEAEAKKIVNGFAFDATP